MTAPGDIVILLILLASFLACAGYAIGRIHQRHQSRPDREEAYRHGYDTATRSVFSMAARTAGRRRTRGAVHGSAAVPAADGSAIVPAADGSAIVPADAESTESPTVQVPAQPSPTATASPAVKAPLATAPAQRTSACRSDPAGPPDEEPTKPVPQTAMGFPAPPPLIGPGLPPPPAAGGVTYSSLPDPRWSGVADLVPEQREPESRRGRHTVPEELVQAATYVLPPDRVARAKVVRRPEDPPVPRTRGTGNVVPPD